jgi:hypothetical protein
LVWEIALQQVVPLGDEPTQFAIEEPVEPFACKGVIALIVLDQATAEVENSPLFSPLLWFADHPGSRHNHGRVISGVGVT